MIVPGLRPDLATDVRARECSEAFESLIESMAIFTESDWSSPSSDIFVSYWYLCEALDSLNAALIGSLLSL